MISRTSKKSLTLDDHVMRAYAIMQAWGDADRDDEILEGACEVRYLDRNEIMVAAEFLAALEKFRFASNGLVSEFLPALLAAGAGGVENLAIEYGVTIPRCASARVSARTAAIRGLAA